MPSRFAHLSFILVIAGCDPLFESRFEIQNQSTHELVAIVDICDPQDTVCRTAQGTPLVDVAPGQTVVAYKTSDIANYPSPDWLTAIHILARVGDGFTEAYAQKPIDDSAWIEGKISNKDCEVSSCKSFTLTVTDELLALSAS
jgi:hypothetical protein